MVVTITAVSAMMTQIYDCVVFLREYGGTGYFRMFLRASNHMVSKIITLFLFDLDTIQRFMEFFLGILRNAFHPGPSSEPWKLSAMYRTVYINLVPLWKLYEGQVKFDTFRDECVL